MVLNSSNDLGDSQDWLVLFESLMIVLMMPCTFMKSIYFWVIYADKGAESPSELLFSNLISVSCPFFVFFSLTRMFLSSPKLASRFLWDLCGFLGGPAVVYTLYNLVLTVAWFLCLLIR